VGSCTSAASSRVAAGYMGTTEESQFFDAESKGLNLYPNPQKSGNRNLALTFEKDPGYVRVRLRDVNGAEVFGKQYNVSSRSLNVELPDLPQGLYMIRIQGEKQSWTRKYLIK